ncbi:MAG: hypothetical protein QGI13_14315 [Rhodospirillales bacterium]|jgi:hypothetical protein|nr:hypothetical protein [Rhodospirillales bacterium]
MMSKAARIVAVALVGALLGGCYMPIRFDAEIEITRTGYYSVIFDGYLVSIPLYRGLREETISPLEENEKVAYILKDFNRDSAVNEVKYFQHGRFKVNWQRKGDLLRARMVTFLRRNEPIITVKYVKDTGLITVQTNPIAKSTAQRLLDNGLSMQGQLRVKTDLQVVDHNATRVLKRKTPIYVWDIKSILDQPPKINMAFR